MNLFSIPYFQSSLVYLKKGLHRTRDAVPTLEHMDDGAMRRADGSYCYEAEYRNAPIEEVQRLAQDCVIVPPEYARNFSGVTEGLVEQLRVFLQEIQTDGRQVAVMLPPITRIFMPI